MQNIEEIRTILIGYTDKKIINGKSLNEIITIDNIPISFFLETFMDPQAMLPKQINPFLTKKFNSIKKIEFKINTILIKIYSKYNEINKLNYFKKKKQFTNNPKCLFLTYTNHLSSDNTIFRIEKIINYIKKDPAIQELVLFTDLLSSNKYKKINDFDNIYQYYDDEISQKAKKLSKEIYFKISHINKEVKKELFKNNNLDLWNQLKYGFEFYFSKQFLYLIILYYEISKKIIEKENVKIVILNGQNGLFDKCILAASKTKNIQSMYIKHGIGTFEYGNQYLNYFTRIAMFNEKEKNKIEKLRKLNNLFVTGPVIFDEIFDFKTKYKKHNQKKVLIVTQALVNDNYLTKQIYFKKMGLLLKELKTILKIEVIIKLHPRDSYKKEWFEIAKKAGLDIQVFDGQISRNEFYKLIGNTNFLIHTGSTCAFEAMILDKSIITYDIAKSKKLTEEFLKCDIGAFIKEPEEIKEALIKVLSKEKIYKKNRLLYIKKICGTIDGNASEKVYQEIKKLIKF